MHSQSTMRGSQEGHGRNGTFGAFPLEQNLICGEYEFNNADDYDHKSRIDIIHEESCCNDSSSI